MYETTKYQQRAWIPIYATYHECNSYERVFVRRDLALILTTEIIRNRLILEMRLLIVVTRAMITANKL